MSKNDPLAAPVDAPVEMALILVCEKCGRRASDSKKTNPSYRLVSELKRRAKRELSKGCVRTVLTSCLDLCPDNRVAVAIVPMQGDRSAIFWEIDIDDVEAASRSLIKAARQVVGPGG